MQLDFAQTPFLVIWETTLACDLACVHCRAVAQPSPGPHELTTAEAEALLDDVAAMGTRAMVLSGGDPLKRHDLVHLIRHGKQRGLRMGTIPAATLRLTRDAVMALKEAGVDRLALSLDAHTAEAHDQFRGVPGTFVKTMEAAAWAHDCGIPLQINSVISAHNVHELPGLMALVESLGIVFWEVFFLVPMGRGSDLNGLTAGECEMLFAQLYECAQRVPFQVKVTEGPHYRRYCMERFAQEHGIDPRTYLDASTDVPPALRKLLGITGSIGGVRHGVNAGKGFAFVSYGGDVYPSGFLPVRVGNVREQPLSQYYRSAALFRLLRDPELLQGRCGHCTYSALCGGSRSRAYALTQHIGAEEPWCAYEPAGKCGNSLLISSGLSCGNE